MNRPLVSVIVPTFNRAALLPRALDSIVAQTFSDWEIVLVDDGSTDETGEVANRYAHELGERFQYVRRANTGCCGARNDGISRARGSFVAFLDSDDEFLPEKLERQLELFRDRPELGLVYCDYSCIDLEGRRFPSAFDEKLPFAREVRAERIGDDLCVCDESILTTMLRGYIIATITGMVRREVLGNEIRFAPDPTYSAEWLFYLRIAKRTSVGFVDAPLCLHHYVAGSVTRSDAHRNTVRHRELFRGMLSDLAPLTREQRAIVFEHLVRTNLQLGYDFARIGQRRAARGRFAEALRFGGRMRALRGLVASSLPRLSGGLAVAGEGRVAAS